MIGCYESASRSARAWGAAATSRRRLCARARPDHALTRRRVEHRARRHAAEGRSAAVVRGAARSGRSARYGAGATTCVCGCNGRGPPSRLGECSQRGSTSNGSHYPSRGRGHGRDDTTRGVSRLARISANCLRGRPRRSPVGARAIGEQASSPRSRGASRAGSQPGISLRTPGRRLGGRNRRHNPERRERCSRCANHRRRRGHVHERLGRKRVPESHPHAARPRYARTEVATEILYTGRHASGVTNLSRHQLLPRARATLSAVGSLAPSVQ